MAFELLKSEDLNVILKERDFSEEKLNEEVTLLKEWINTQPHLPNNQDINFLRSFVIWGKGLELAKDRLDSYYTARTRFPNLFKTRYKITFGDKLTRMFYLPKLTPEFSRVFMVNLRSSDVQLFDHSEKLRKNLMLADTLLIEGDINLGLILIYDIANLTHQIVANFTPTLARQALLCYQRAMPFRIKSVIIINAPSFTESFINTLFRPFISPKIFERIHIYSKDHEILKDHLPIEMLPEDYGGLETSSEELNDKWEMKLLSLQEWFSTSGLESAFEEKRPKKRLMDDFGIDGSFRALNID